MTTFEKKKTMTTYQKYKLVILTVFGVIALVILYNYSENGRYVFSNESNFYVLDSKNGVVHKTKDLLVEK